MNKCPKWLAKAMMEGRPVLCDFTFTGLQPTRTEIIGFLCDPRMPFIDEKFLLEKRP